MIPTQITESVLALPESERLELARRIVESIAAERDVRDPVSKGVLRIEDIVVGRTPRLSEVEFRRALG